MGVNLWGENPMYMNPVPSSDDGNESTICYFGATPFAIHSLVLLRRTEGADEKIVEGLPAVIGEVAGSGAGKRI